MVLKVVLMSGKEVPVDPSSCSCVAELRAKVAGALRTVPRRVQLLSGQQLLRNAQNLSNLETEVVLVVLEQVGRALANAAPARDPLLGAVGVCLDRMGAVYVAEAGADRVTRWPSDGNVCEVVAGGHGVADGSALASPAGIFLVPGQPGEEPALYVAEAAGDRVTKWRPGAGSGATVALGSSPSAVFVDSAGAVYVAEAGAHRVTRWLPGATAGTVVAGGRGPGEALNQLDTPTGVFVHEESIYVAEALNHRVTRWSPGAFEGEVVAGGYGAGFLFEQISYPTGVVVDRHGTVFVAEAGNDRVTCWDPGCERGDVAAGEVFEKKVRTRPKGFCGLAVDAAGSVYVSESTLGRVTCWTPGAACSDVAAGGGCRGSRSDSWMHPSGFFRF